VSVTDDLAQLPRRHPVMADRIRWAQSGPKSRRDFLPCHPDSVAGMDNRNE
jgi:hypothetical protein